MTARSELNKLIELVLLIPEGAKADWDGTNHYEITSPNSGNYFWLDLLGAIGHDGSIDSDTDDGKKVGLIMDIAVQARAALDELANLGILPTDNNHEGNQT